MTRSIDCVASQVNEWGYDAACDHDDPFNDLELNVVLRHSDGQKWTVPAFWAGGRKWRVRFAPPRAGNYEIETVCSDRTDGGLHGRVAVARAAEYSGDNPLLERGPLRVAATGRSFEHRDGTPFFWLGDCWWMALCRRISWPGGFQHLTADRVSKGFTVIQIVAGLYPDMPGFDPRGANEAGFPWTENYARIDPAYFDKADLRIDWLVQSGLVPCIVGGWGYYLPLMGIEKMRRHWRYLIARWSAYPVVWCLAGEGSMPYYLSDDEERDHEKQIDGWTALAGHVHDTDPCGHPITIHPGGSEMGRDQVRDDAVLDFDMLQTGHILQNSLPYAVRSVAQDRRREPVMPFLIGEGCYEGILHGNHAEVQRLLFWLSILSGAAGHTYGANGVWQLNGPDEPYGPSPHGGNWGNMPWEEAMQLPGSGQVGLARKFLERYPWMHFEPHQEWIEPSGSERHSGAGFAAGIPGKLRVIYFYDPILPWQTRPTVVGIESDRSYAALFWDPITGKEHAIGRATPDTDGRWLVPLTPEFRDWVVVMKVG